MPEGEAVGESTRVEIRKSLLKNGTVNEASKKEGTTTKAKATINREMGIVEQ